MTPFYYLSNCIFTRIKPSKIQGVGIFALKDIPENTNPFQVWEGESGLYNISENELKTLDKDLYSHVKDMFEYSPNFPEDTDTYIKLINGFHWIYQNPYYFVNSGFERANIDKDTFLTTRKIRKGEEILSNYGRYERFPKKELI